MAYCPGLQPTFPYSSTKEPKQVAMYAINVSQYDFIVKLHGISREYFNDTLIKFFGKLIIDIRYTEVERSVLMKVRELYINHKDKSNYSKLVIDMDEYVSAYIKTLNSYRQELTHDGRTVKTYTDNPYDEYSEYTRQPTTKYNFK
jgi:hypothetical protein